MYQYHRKWSKCLETNTVSKLKKNAVIIEPGDSFFLLENMLQFATLLTYRHGALRSMKERENAQMEYAMYKHEEATAWPCS